MLLAANNDRVRESTSTVGAGDLALLGAVVGFRAFSAVLNDQDVRPYTIEGLNSGGGPSGEWETGLGTYNAGLNTLSRTTVLASSNAGAAVVFSAGAKQVWIDAPAAFLSGLLQAGNNLADVANVATARHSLGLDAVDAPTFAGLTLTGHVLAPDGTLAAPSYSFSSSTGSGLRWNAVGTGIDHIVAGAAYLFANAGHFRLKSSTPLEWSSGDPSSLAGDLFAFRDGTGTLALRNGSSAHSLRIYGNFVDVSNYQRLSISTVSGGTTTMVQEAAGTGAVVGFRIGTSGNANLQFRTNGVDNWFIGGTGTLAANTDNASDIGAPAANRPRNIFAAGGIGLKVKAGAIIDGDFTNPTDGMIAADSTNSKLWMRLGGVWKSVVLA